MLKNKYQRMSREEKKELKVNYYQTNEGKYTKQKLLNSKLYSLLLGAWSLYNIIMMIIKKDYTFVNIVLIVFSASFAILFIVLIHKVESNKLNDFAIEEEKKKKKPKLENEIEKEYKKKKKK